MITPPLLNDDVIPDDVIPGDPITSEIWNNLLEAIRIVYKFLNSSLGTFSVNLKNQADGNPVAGAVVTVIPIGESDGRPIRVGLFAGFDVQRYFVHQLEPGAYKVVAEVNGFTTETREITMDEEGAPQALIIEMSPTELLFPVPNLFGIPLNKAIDAVMAMGFQVVHIIDSHGTEIPPRAIPDDAQVASVLNQVPEPGTLIPKNAPIQIHIAAKAEFVERVKVPDLKGLTLDEAKAKLGTSSLVLGESSTVK
jgi:hypothetical protein